MKVTLNIPDDLYDELKARCAGQNPDKAAVNKRIRAVLTQFNGVGARGRFFIVDHEDRQRLEAIFETTIHDAADLFKKLSNLSVVGIGDAVKHLTPGESIQLRENASFWGQEPAEYMKNTLQRCLDEGLGRV